MKKIIILFIAALFHSCTQELETIELGFKPEIVVTSYLRPDTTITVILSESVDIFTLNQPGPILNAQVDMYENDILLGRLTETSIEPGPLEVTDPLRGVYQIDYRPRIGSTYRLEVTHDDYPNVHAETVLPQQTSTFDIELVADLVWVNESVKGIREGLVECDANIRISDAVGKNFYQISVITETQNLAVEFEDGQPVLVESLGEYRDEIDYTSSHVIFDNGTNDSFGGDGDGGEVFNDDLFDQDELEIQISFPMGLIEYTLDGITSDAGGFKIEIRSLSEEYYNYLYSTNLQESITEDPFAEPVQIFSNVENGLGIFGGYNIQTFEYDLIGLLPED